MWDYLKDNGIEKLESHMISKSLEFIQTLNLFGDSNIVQIMQSLPSTDSKYPRVHSLLTDIKEDMERNLPAMCQLVKTEKFVSHDKLKLVVISDTDENNDSGIVRAMSGYRPSVGNSSFITLPSMKNTVVVYQEYCYLGNVNGISKVFNPLVHICYQPQVLESIINKGDGFNDSRLRIAYLSKKQILDDSTLKIK